MKQRDKVSSTSGYYERKKISFCSTHFMHNKKVPCCYRYVAKITIESRELGMVFSVQSVENHEIIIMIFRNLCLFPRISGHRPNFILSFTQK